MALTQSQLGSLQSHLVLRLISQQGTEMLPHICWLQGQCLQRGYLQSPKKAGAEVLRAVGTWSCALIQPQNKPRV